MNSTHNAGDITATLRDAFLITCTAEGRDIDDMPQRRNIDMAVIPNTPDRIRYLDEAVDFCERMRNAFPLGSGDGNYNLVWGIEKWFYVDFADEEDQVAPVYAELTACNRGNEWPLDPEMTHLDPTVQMSFVGYRVRYFDMDGVERHVSRETKIRVAY